MACKDCKKNPFSPSQKEFWLLVGGIYVIGSAIFTTYYLLKYLFESL